ncbi:methyltransferase [Sphingomonas crocodyli]|uniref:Methyltransferase n=1 Tax=Sphingomonas crocodyli TaxID=1979270 RepID=A0A437LYG2_9SPHN|nr:methyltransferase [Sphingomonas crocodyli]RVT90373.1 methyltransferase [Sphingomonas crocodyli]
MSGLADSDIPRWTREDLALLELLRVLRRQGYEFVTPTPATHQRVLARASSPPRPGLTDIFGWSRPFLREQADPAILALLEAAHMLEPVDNGRARSRIRVSSLFGDLFAHSAFPTDAPDAVFFGPDSYRFARLIRDELARDPASRHAHVVDIGTGAGVGAIAAGRLAPQASLTLTDINPAALRLASINAAAAGRSVSTHLGANIDGVDDPIDLALANPPYMIDPHNRDYRDGGNMHGAAVAVRMVEDTLPRLVPGGRLILYSGSAIVDGADALGRALAERASGASCDLTYEELDPDVFGEELETPAYHDVDRIAVVAAIFRKRDAR